MAIHVRVSGRVQGVGFRQFVQRMARKLEVAGWVRNREDGSSVELEAEGNRQSIETLIERIETGPPGSRVDEIDLEWTTPPGLPEPFEIRR